VPPPGGRAGKRRSEAAKRGKVLAVAVQLGVQLQAWVPAIRRDMAHGPAHIDSYETASTKTTQSLNLSSAEALALADEDILEH
jgi:hypothetical protein